VGGGVLNRQFFDKNHFETRNLRLAEQIFTLTV